jgi:hypothetical protein
MEISVITSLKEVLPTQKLLLLSQTMLGIYSKPASQIVLPMNNVQRAWYLPSS